MNFKKQAIIFMGAVLLFCFLCQALPAESAKNASGQPSQAASQQDAQPQIRFVWDYAGPLRLTADQLKQMRAAFDLFQKSMIQLKAKLQLSEIDLNELLSQDADMKTIAAQVQKSAAIQGEMRFSEIKMNHTVMGLLTPEQQKRWRQILAGGSAAAMQNTPAQKPAAAPPAKH